MPKLTQETLELLQAKLGYSFARPALLVEALTHSSLRHEVQTSPHGTGRDSTGGNGTRSGADPGDNERLEFLGDAIVGMVVGESLFRRYPQLREGELTRLRAALVSRKYLGEIGAQLELGSWLRMGRSEDKNGGRTKAVLLANCVEALIAAMYLDPDPGLSPTPGRGGLVRVAEWIERVIVEPEADTLYRELQSKHAIGDYKSALQELLQARGCGQPEYMVEGESGPDHRKHFLVEVRTAATDPEGGRGLARGRGSTKKNAEQEAARRALRHIADGGKSFLGEEGA